LPQLSKSSLATLVGIAAGLAALLSNADRIMEFASPSFQIDIESATATLEDETVAPSGELDRDHAARESGLHEYTIHVRSVVRKPTTSAIYNCEPVVGHFDDNESIRQIDGRPEYYGVGLREVSGHYEFHLSSRGPPRQLGFRIECDGGTSNIVVFTFEH